MRNIQFAQPFAQQFGKIIVVADVGQELAVGSCHGIPVHTMHVHIIETFLFLLVDMLKHISTFGCQIHLHLSSERNRLQCFRRGIHFLHAASQNENILSFLVHFHGTASHILVQQFHVALAEINLPQVITAFECSQIIQFLTVLGKNGRAQVR